MNRNLMEVERPIKKPTQIIIGNDATLKQRLIAIFLGPLLLAICFLKIHFKEYGYFVPSLDYILACSVLAFPFAFYISYKWYRNLGIKVILTDQQVIKKPQSGQALYLYWSEIKKIYIKANPENKIVNLTFTRKKRYRLFDKKNQIHCPPGAVLNRKYLPRDAVGLILKKIDLYKIPVKGDRSMLEITVWCSDESPPKAASTAAPLPHKTVRKRLPAGSSSQTPRPK